MAMLFFLSIFSIPYVRARTYELFVHSHILAAIVYLGLMFWHAGDLGDSVSILRPPIDLYYQTCSPSSSGPICGQQ